MTQAEEIINDFESARDWLLTGERLPEKIEINACISELNDAIERLKQLLQAPGLSLR